MAETEYPLADREELKSKFYYFPRKYEPKQFPMMQIHGQMPVHGVTRHVRLALATAVDVRIEKLRASVDVPYSVGGRAITYGIDRILNPLLKGIQIHLFLSTSQILFTGTFRSCPPLGVHTLLSSQELIELVIWKYRLGLPLYTLKFWTLKAAKNDHLFRLLHLTDEQLSKMNPIIDRNLKVAEENKGSGDVYLFGSPLLGFFSSSEPFDTRELARVWALTIESSFDKYVGDICHAKYKPSKELASQPIMIFVTQGPGGVRRHVLDLKDKNLIQTFLSLPCEVRSMKLPESTRMRTWMRNHHGYIKILCLDGCKRIFMNNYYYCSLCQMKNVYQKYSNVCHVCCGAFEARRMTMFGVPILIDTKKVSWLDYKSEDSTNLDGTVEFTELNPVLPPTDSVVAPRKSKDNLNGTQEFMGLNSALVPTDVILDDLFQMGLDRLSMHDRDIIYEN